MQLPLPVSLPTDETFDSFVAGNNEQLYTLLSVLAAHISDWREVEQLQPIARLPVAMLNIVGASGRGKSHLLYALCHQLAARRQSHVLLNLNDANQWQPQVLDALENVAVICLDNIHAIAGRREWEVALFDLINRVQETARSILVCSSRIGVSHPDFELPDLRSRLAWGLTYTLKPLTDRMLLWRFHHLMIFGCQPSSCSMKRAY